jgi:flagellar biosynthesis/type III secretory pathway protein FliH
MKIIKASEQTNFEPFNVASFSTVKRGEDGFNLKIFGTDEIPVQDKLQDPSRHATHKLDSDEPADEPADKTFTENTFENVEAAELIVPESQQELSRKNAEVAKKDAEVAQLANEINKLRSQIDKLNKNIEEEKASFPDLFEKARQEGYEKAKAEKSKAYEAEKNDYAAGLDRFYTDAQTELKKVSAAIDEIDAQLPQIVLGYVREIIGAECKLNDEVVVNIVTQALRHLHDLQSVVFVVNPDDAAAVTEKFPGHGVSIDASVPKGAVKVRTKVGEIDLSVDSWLNSLEKQIDEKFRTTENDNV